ncbi:hypothetical protein JT358_00135 [Micrococcales bacterium 31B]|nr:hypothetical protein [Micrococcales bacterium 31B]
MVVDKPVAQCTVSGYVWKDANKNGIMDSGEEKVPGVNVALRGLTTGQNDYPGTLLDVPAQTTDANGFYKFTVPGELCGRILVDFNEAQYPAGWTPFGFGDSDLRGDVLDTGWTTPFDLAPGMNLERVDAGLRQPGGSLTGLTCSPLTEGFKVELMDTEKAVLQTTTINHGGQFGFSDVPDGAYQLRLTKLVNSGDPTYVFMVGGNIITTVANYWSSTTWHVESLTKQFTITGDQSLNFAEMCGQFMSPLVLDLNGNGMIDTSSAADQPEGATFDLLGTGSGVASGWAADGDGFLVRPNADGTITSIDNLFGGSLGAGFAQLAALDTNGDGVVSGAELDGLNVWVDANNDHVAQASEISTLADHGVTSLNTAFANTPVANNGNVVIEHGSADTASGESLLVGDAYFEITGALNADNQVALAASAAHSAATLATLPLHEQNAIANAYAAAAGRS